MKEYSQADFERDMDAWVKFGGKKARYTAIEKAGLDDGDDFVFRILDRAIPWAIKNPSDFKDMITVALAIKSLGSNDGASVAEAIQYAQNYPAAPISPIQGLKDLAAEDESKNTASVLRAREILKALPRKDEAASYME